MKIRVLEPLVVDQIAAGEVIERPASVVKELVENSLDAGAGNILVEILEGGTRLIRVRDDGEGISEEDLPLAFTSHATSKLSGVDDLDRIGSFGFRGEALASIGAVSMARIVSRTAESPQGWEVTCKGGRVGGVKPAASPPGTTVEVAELFYNTPARKRFLKSPAAERGRIADLVARLALAHTEAGWTLRAAGRDLLHFPPGSDLSERVGQALGKEFASHMVEVSGRKGDYRVEGFVADPAKLTYRDARRQLLFVNGRLVKDRALAVAVQQGLEESLMTGRRPGFILFLSLPPSQVDVNVHPTKSEVRFRAPSLLFSLVREAVKPVAGRTGRAFQAGGGPAVAAPGGTPPGLGPGRSGGGRVEEPPPRPLFPSDLEAPSFKVPSGGTFPALEEGKPSTEGGAGESLRRTASGASAGRRPFLQVGGAYLVLPWGDGFAVVDQHALHERILYEELTARLKGEKGRVPSQGLLQPRILELSREEKALLLSKKDDIERLGFRMGDFGPGAVAVEAVPAPLSGADPGEIMEEILAALEEKKGARSGSLEDRIATAACRAAVKSGDRLTAVQVDALISMAREAENPGHCPHGRPTVLVFSKADLEKLFRRRPES